MAKGRVLILENEGIIASNIESILEDNGYACAGACSSIAEAEAVIRGAPVDAVLLDVMMRDDATSYDLCEELAKRDIPFGFITGLPREAIKKKWRGRPHCEKPFLEEDILQIVAELMSDRAGLSAQIPAERRSEKTWLKP